MNSLLMVTSFIFRLSLCPCAVPEHLYQPSSSTWTSVTLADLSQVEPCDEGRANDEGRWPKEILLTLSQSKLVGVKPVENTQGSLTAEPTAAYTFMLSSGGWIIPVRDEGKRKKSLLFKMPPLCPQCLWRLT